MLRFLIPCLWIGLAAAPGALAQNANSSGSQVSLGSDAAEATDVARLVIRHQLAAFQNDDADEAYSDAAPTVQMAFPDALEFLAMVAYHYPAIYRHSHVDFGDAAEKDGHIAQSVLITDGNGKVWQAIYKLEQEPDAHWKIVGCVVAATAAQGL